MHGRDDVAVADALSPELRAFPGKGHPPVTRIAPGAPELLLGECREVAHQVADKVRGQDPLSNIICIDGTYFFCQDKFGLELVGHGLESGCTWIQSVLPRYPKCHE